MSSSAVFFSEEDQNFIREHLTEDPAKLALKYAKQPEKKRLVAQVKARQQVRKKLPDWYADPKIEFPTGLPLEQCSSQETAKLKASLISGKHLLDITGGFGVDTYYLSKSFDSATYVEKNQDLARVAEQNFKSLGTDIQVKITDGIDELDRSGADVVYVDPHRRDDTKRKMVDLKDCIPDVTTHLDKLTLSGRIALVKASPMLDIPKALLDLRHVEQVWVISLRNECKEVVFLLNESFSDAVKAKTFNLTPDRIEEFEFVLGSAPEKTALSAPQQYLYEPNSSILKAGAEDLAAEKFGLPKLHPHSHFYTSDEPVENFPGKTFAVEEVLKPWDKSLRSRKLNVISRNFPAKADAIEKKLRLTPGQRNYLLATKLKNEDLKFIVCRLLANI